MHKWEAEGGTTHTHRTCARVISGIVELTRKKREEQGEREAND